MLSEKVNSGMLELRNFLYFSQTTVLNLTSLPNYASDLHVEASYWPREMDKGMMGLV